ncbi:MULTISPECIES: CPBP family intramembrane glutamic endopeptidase [unclassified Treponema]|uniref:CPBP family intramembrane glutamic endopeptidase n=1 Tax=unclassified Treponema TaxID=2638727 RepID=UPI0020A59685|nr:MULTISPECIES: CPBP family intramembrane glutamic endopeptidase [unclassified Treponema]UTC67777.1 CPBP family intramembrane metalloprotease [Treponema sp. OMZ 789]UTC70502.1 CPBP family intramembrane metalloprotease [Treponema sp. OMZ 790]UTC73214.1 CPBP family intramembrane metalloprotease [Treponema sp. OMZ 791]
MRFDKKTIRILAEFTFIFIVFVLPPILNNKEFSMPPKPQGFFKVLIFAAKIVFLAAYEEVLYRIYLPYRIKTLLGNTNKFGPYLSAPEILSVLLFALAHRYLGFFNMLYALAAGIIFRILYLAFKKKMECKTEQKKAIITAALIVTIIHSCNNGIVYLLFIL